MNKVDFKETGSGPIIVLLHASASSLRQWNKLINDHSRSFRFIAINLLGYGKTPKWQLQRTQTLDDQAKKINDIISLSNTRFSIVGHSFGGTVGMKVATYFKGRIDRLILIEPNPFYLLKQNNELKEYDKVLILRNIIKSSRDKNWINAVATFADYWNGVGTWDLLDNQKKKTFARILEPNFHEWDSVINEPTSIGEWKSLLPQKTTIISSRKTVSPIKKIVELFKSHCSNWNFEEIDFGGHMAPITHPERVNEIIIKLLMKD